MTLSKWITLRRGVLHIHFNRWVHQNGLPRGGVYGHAVVKVLLGGTHLHSHTEALVESSIAKDVLQHVIFAPIITKTMIGIICTKYLFDNVIFIS